MSNVDRRIAQAEAYVQSRFYPPLPVEYGAMAVLAVDLLNEGRGDELIDVPDHVRPQPRQMVGDAVRADVLVDILRLHHLIDEQ